MTIDEQPLDERLALMGANTLVPLVSGEHKRYVNLDYAASTPALEAVARAVSAFLPWYSSVHRGAGFKSRVATAAYEGARESVRAFCGARHDDAVIFTRNTTDSLNMLAHCLPPDARVVAFAGEHHANLLPWRRRAVTYVPLLPSPEETLGALEDTLRRAGDVALVSVTGASNVTGEIWPLTEIVALARRYGARVALDAAQLAPHHPIDMASLDVDFLAMSGHKLYAPYGAGALIGRPDWLSAGDPFLAGGGAVEFVTLEGVAWTTLPDRQEAGSPNVIGAVALGVACQTLAAVGMGRLAEQETHLYAYAVDRLATVEGLETYYSWSPRHARVGIVPMNLHGYHYAHLAEVLSAEFGIGLRHGCFCAHPLVMHLLRCSGLDSLRIRSELASGDHRSKPGAVRMSLGLGASSADVDALVAALQQVARDGPRWTYRRMPPGDVFEPHPDPRAWPDLPLPLSMANASGGRGWESS